MPSNQTLTVKSKIISYVFPKPSEYPLPFPRPPPLPHSSFSAPTPNPPFILTQTAIYEVNKYEVKQAPDLPRACFTTLRKCSTHVTKCRRNIRQLSQHVQGNKLNSRHRSKTLSAPSLCSRDPLLARDEWGPFVRARRAARSILGRYWTQRRTLGAGPTLAAGSSFSAGRVGWFVFIATGLSVFIWPVALFLLRLLGRIQPSGPSVERERGEKKKRKERKKREGKIEERGTKRQKKKKTTTTTRTKQKQLIDMMNAS